jgi:hypothetical protein
LLLEIENGGSFSPDVPRLLHVTADSLIGCPQLTHHDVTWVPTKTTLQILSPIFIGMRIDLITQTRFAVPTVDLVFDRIFDSEGNASVTI